MNIAYQYYNEIVLAFNNYETDFEEGVIIIYVPDDEKPFDLVCDKISAQIKKIAEILDERDQPIVIQIRGTNEKRDIFLEKE